jgi:DNA-binding winged helix-turn-helix (wHTH) protein
VDLASGELRIQVLLALLERPQEVVTREELQNRLWSGDTSTDFDRGLNKAISRLRDALLDNAANPRFIGTLPQRGYRWLIPVERVPSNVLPLALPERDSPPMPRRSLLFLAGSMIAAPVAGVIAYKEF